MKTRLITAALPYVNNLPHLGNIVQLLSSDCFARYCRLNFYPTLYICGTDDYGTAVEIEAKKKNKDVQVLCDELHQAHKEIYDWFNLSFDVFGRTATSQHTEIVQDIFQNIDNNGFLIKEKSKQLYSQKYNIFLADRYIQGECPHCHYGKARGDQCESCGTLLDAIDLINPEASDWDEKNLLLKETENLFLDFSRLENLLREYLIEHKDLWSTNAYKMTEAWLKDGLKKRSISRDLKWGVPINKEDFENKVFYVWFEAPIGYISILANAWANWENFWKNPNETLLYQFMGKDNIPFHTIFFPLTLIASDYHKKQTDWTLLYRISSTEYLNFEGSKFSKSAKVGIFAHEVINLGLSADIIRFYLLYNRPENSDTNFSWENFQSTINKELVANFSNLIHRVFSFAYRIYQGNMPDKEKSLTLWQDKIIPQEKLIQEAFEKVELKKALKIIFSLIYLANKTFQDSEPWKETDRSQLDQVMYDLIYLIHNITIYLNPFIPEASATLLNNLGQEKYDFTLLNRDKHIISFKKPKPLFHFIDDKKMADLKQKIEKNNSTQLDIFSWFHDLDLRVGFIQSVVRHPNADKLYILNVDIAGEIRQVVSGLVDFYTIDDLVSKKIVYLANLKKIKIRGESSNGMILACSFMDGDKELIELINVEDKAIVGESIRHADFNPMEKSQYDVVSIDYFTQNTINILDYSLYLDKVNLICAQSSAKIFTQILKQGKLC